MSRLVFVVLCVFLVACNDNDDKQASNNNVVSVDPLGDLSPTALSVEMPPTDGKLPTDLFPPQ